jgi:membrane fusion protein (multidrug efflux system)
MEPRTVAKVSLVALAATVALSSLGCSRGDDSGPAAAQASAAAAAPTPAPVSVTVQTVESQRVERTVDFVGTLHAFAEAEVAAEVDGRLTAISADLGDQVAKGQILATLEGSELEAKLREAEASLQKNQNDQRRAQQLRDQKIMSQQEFDAIASAASVSQARRDVLAIQVEHTRIRAPFDGRIAKRQVDVGNYVRTGTPVFVLVADNPLRLRGEVPERFAAEVKTGQEVRGFVEAYPDDAIDGRLTRISPAANPESRALTVEALVPNGDGLLKTGFFCKAQILTRTDAEALVVPVEALVSFAGVTRVFVVDEAGVAHGREVETGLRLGAMVEVSKGLTAGERVATSGLARLSEGTRVVVRDTDPSPAARKRGASDTAGPVRIDPAPAAQERVGAIREGARS